MGHNSYANKVAFVTGGTSGIGKATAIAFADAGTKVVLAGRREKEGAAVVDEIKKRGGEASFIRTDVTKEDDVKAAVDFTVKTYGRLDAAFNNAGIEIVCPLNQITEEQYQNTFNLNVWGVLCSMKHEVAAMQKTGGGAIVNTSSMFGLVGAAYASIYAGSKFAVEGLTKSIAVEIAKQNIRVNAVAPGAIQTEMIDRFIANTGEARDDLIAKHPIGRFGTSEEIAAAVLYLCSDAAKFTIGSTLSVDGGYRAW
ncbi:glucose 1-dehydrogenase [Ktedonobacter racemifer]|uniref:Short-chain dehydrogenase/reductase SDR n=1 Tax=Ktedonobacter racemifer DSM 44963 TaxID=485913 RepID=D6TWK4_KTERA|nr:glucose 1-dehydrogenase [Ktedonobacter racemifer]EFH84587.1 short-chain dehydrogenase/reductase SDR [Ktedonobacter racemifer DSM 44963]